MCPKSLNLLSLMRLFSIPEKSLVNCPVSLQWSIPLLTQGFLSLRINCVPLNLKKVSEIGLAAETVSILMRESW